MKWPPIPVLILSILIFLAGINALLGRWLWISTTGLEQGFLFDANVLGLAVGPGLFFLKNGWRLFALAYTCLFIMFFLFSLISVPLAGPGTMFVNFKDPDLFSKSTVIWGNWLAYSMALLFFWVLTNPGTQRAFNPAGNHWHGYRWILLALTLLGAPLLAAYSVKFNSHVQRLTALYSTIQTEFHDEISFLQEFSENQFSPSDESKTALSDSRILLVNVNTSPHVWASLRRALNYKRISFTSAFGPYQTGIATTDSDTKIPIAIYSGRTGSDYPFVMYVDTSKLSPPSD